MNTEITELQINGETYIKKGSGNNMASNTEGLPYCIVRTYSAGVFAGYLGKREGKEGTVYNARRIYYWSGAASLSEMALSGVSKPKECKFPAEVTSVLLTEIIEILPATEEARKCIQKVPVWSAK